MTKLWLDDMRQCPRDYDIWAKTVPEAIEHLKTGKITFISFDNDLGFPDLHLEGRRVADWIMEQAYYKNIPQLGWRVHSANIVARPYIIQSMIKAEEYWNRE